MTAVHPRRARMLAARVGTHGESCGRVMLPPSIPPQASDEMEFTLQELLARCATNLTEKAAQGDLVTAYEREQEIEQILTSLASPLKGRIVVTGGPRVGKTAVIQAVAARIQAGRCPEALKGCELWALSARSILRAFGVQDWQERLGQLMMLWADHPEVILVVDALPTTLSAGATLEDPFDMAQFLLGQLQSSTNRLLAEGRTQAVNVFFEAYPEYRHILMEVRIAEPPLEAARRMVMQAAEDMEIRQGVAIDREAVEAALDLTRRFALHEQLPGKAIDLLEEGIALHSARGEARPRVTKEDIIARFGEKTGLPGILLSDDEPYDEQAVRRAFSEKVLGQDQAVDVIVQTLSLLRTRLNNPFRPMGVFLFIGPTGVGKTELARALANFLFSGDEHIVRFNMADYSADWHVQTLFGNPHGFDLPSRRGQLTMRLQDHAFAVILLDEFEKAHPEVFQRFLQLFDEGMLINGASEIVNLRNTIVILTSNFGAHLLSSGKLGFGPAVTLEEQEQRIREEMVAFFTPELINRVDSVVFFKPLTKPVLREIAYRRVQEILQREGIARRGIEVEVDEDVIEWVVEHGYSERYGARYLARQIEKTITYPLAQQLIRNDPPSGSMLRLFMRNGRVASALVLPATAHPPEEAMPITATLPRRRPQKLSSAEMRANLPLLRQRIEALESAHGVREARQKLADLMQAMSTPSFWDDPQAVQPRLEEMGRLSGQVELVDGLRRNLSELSDLLESGDAEQGDLFSEAALRYRYLLRELPRAELTLLFSSAWDACGAYLHVAARGRRDVARQWVVQLAHMYLNWAMRRGFRTTILSENVGDGGTAWGVWLRIEGDGVYGLLRGETGIHRLIQPSPHQPERRQVVQAIVTVWPDLPEDSLPPLDADLLHMEVKPIDQAGLLGGQLTTCVRVQFSEQEALTLVGSLPPDDFKREAVALLRIRMAADEQAKVPGVHPVWGRVTRSYVRYKQQYVHDPRTGLRTGKLKATLKGELDPFIEARLRPVSNTDR